MISSEGRGGSEEMLPSSSDIGPDARRNAVISLFLASHVISRKGSGGVAP